MAAIHHLCLKCFSLNYMMISQNFHNYIFSEVLLSLVVVKLNRVMTLKTKIKNKILKREIISSLSPNQLFETVHVKRLYLGKN